MCLATFLTGSAKVSKGEILIHFNEIFDALSKVRLPEFEPAELMDSFRPTPRLRSRMEQNYWTD